MKFEYITEDIPLTWEMDKIMVYLNGKGQEGWEAIHFYSKTVTLKGFAISGARQFILFKRQVPNG